MLKGIPSVLSPELLKTMMEMGHGDEIVLANGNFPAASCAQRLIRADGLTIPVLLDAILKFFPLDSFVKCPSILMSVPPDYPNTPVIWESYREIIRRYEPAFSDFEFLERFEFYDRAKKAYAIVSCGDLTRYSNIIIKKGVVAG